MSRIIKSVTLNDIVCIHPIYIYIELHVHLKNPIVYVLVCIMPIQPFVVYIVQSVLKKMETIFYNFNVTSIASSAMLHGCACWDYSF